MPDGSKVITLIDQFNAALEQAFALFMLKTGL